MIGGVLVEKTEKTGAGTEVGVGYAKVGAVQPALGGVGGIVASIVHPGSAELRNQGRLLEKGDLFGWDIQIRDQNFAETVAAENGGGVRDLIGQLNRPFVMGFAEGVDVLGLFYEGGSLKAEVRIAERARHAV